MSNDPDQIRDEIEATRSDLSANVNALAETVRPGNVARRQAERLKGGVSDITEKVMGTADEATSSTGAAVESARDALVSVPSAARRRARGNPVAAGLIAFGAGWLIGSLLPASSAEEQAAAALKEKAEPLTDQVTQAAKEVAGNLQDPAQQAMEQVKSAASDAASTVKDQAQSNAADLKTSSQNAVDEVRRRSSP